MKKAALTNGGSKQASEDWIAQAFELQICQVRVPKYVWVWILNVQKENKNSFQTAEKETCGDGCILVYTQSRVVTPSGLFLANRTSHG